MAKVTGSNPVEPTALSKPKPAKDICLSELRDDDEASELESDRVSRVHRVGRRIRGAGLPVLPEPTELHVRRGLRWVPPAPDLRPPQGLRNQTGAPAVAARSVMSDRRRYPYDVNHLPARFYRLAGSHDSRVDESRGARFPTSLRWAHTHRRGSPPCHRDQSSHLEPRHA